MTLKSLLNSFYLSFLLLYGVFLFLLYGECLIKHVYKYTFYTAKTFPVPLL